LARTPPATRLAGGRTLEWLPTSAGSWFATLRRCLIALSTRRSPLLALLLSIAFVVALVPGRTAAAATVWDFNTYRSAGYLTQDPYYTACTGAAAMMMLNFIALSGNGGRGFAWRTSRTKNVASDPDDMDSIYTFARNHDTLSSGSAGSDAHGWRNALNYFGWGEGAMVDPRMRVYDDRAYGSFDAAVKDAVRAIARFHKPVGMLGWAGGHAQVITGYRASGEDPATSDAFTVNALYLADPLASNQVVNKLVWVSTLRSGPLTYRFRTYRQADSPHDDPYTAGTIRSSVSRGPSEWYGRYVLILPIRSGLRVETR
jgi:hypothetical protein